MDNNINEAELIYKQQRGYVFFILALFALLTCWLANGNVQVMLYCVITFVLAFVTDRQQTFLATVYYRIILLITQVLLQITMSFYVGADELPLWIFSGAFVLQCVFLVQPQLLQIALVSIILLGVFFTGYIQHSVPTSIVGHMLFIGACGVVGIKSSRLFVDAFRKLSQKTATNLRITEELMLTKNFQRQVLDSTSNAIVATDLNGQIIEFNTAAEKMLGYKQYELLHKQTPIIYINKEQLEKHIAHLNKRYHTKPETAFEALVYKNKIGLTNSEEWFYQTKYGLDIIVQQVIASLKNSSGQAIGYLITATDITTKKTEEEQQQTAETIIANSPSVLFRWMPDDDWTIRYVSANVIDVIGYTSLDFTTAVVTYPSLIHPNDVINIQRLTQQSINNKITQMSLEYRVKHKQGHYIWVAEHTFLKRNAENELEFFEGIITDITRRKIAEEQLKESELRYELAVKGTAAGIWDWVNVNTSDEWWAPRFYELLGYENNELPSSLDTFFNLLHPDDIESTRKGIEDHFNYDLPYLVEYRLKTKSGRYKWFLGSGQLHRDTNGKPKRMVGSIIDIDAKKQKEELLTKKEERYRLLVESARDIFYNADERGKFVYANTIAETITGYSKEELLNMRYLELVRHDYKKEIGEFYLQQIKAKKELTYCEFPITTKNGETKWIGQNVQVLYHNQDFMGIQAVARDISEFKNTQLKLQAHTIHLERTNKELDQFAYVVSHDLKAPLRGIANIAEWIKEELAPHLTNETNENFALLNKRIKRLEQFINGLLQYSRAGRKNIKVDQVNTTQIIDDAIEMAQIPEHFTVTKHVDELVFDTDLISLEQVLNNLISNAIKYNNNSKPLIDITCKKNNSKLHFTITDNGPGIATEYHKKVFQIFQTLESRDQYESTGIGLAIVKKIIEDKNETIKLHSDTGRGCRFEFTWPIHLMD